MTGLPAFVAHQAQGFVDGVLAHRAFGVLLAREHQVIASSDFLKLAQDGDGLAG